MDHQGSQEPRLPCAPRPLDLVQRLVSPGPGRGPDRPGCIVLGVAHGLYNISVVAQGLYKDIVVAKGLYDITVLVVAQSLANITVVAQGLHNITVIAQDLYNIAVVAQACII